MSLKSSSSRRSRRFPVKLFSLELSEIYKGLQIISKIAWFIFSEEASQALWEDVTVCIEMESDLWVKNFEESQAIFKMMA